MESREIQAGIHEVVLLEDRAHVYRRGRLELPAGRHRLLVGGVAPVLADKTLAVSLEDGTGVSVVGARVRRTAVFRDPDTDDSDLGALERELRDLDRQAERAAYDRALIEDQARSLDRIASLTYADLATDVAWGKPIDESWRERLGAMRSRERELAERLAEMDADADDRDRTRERLRRRVAAMKNPSATEQASLEIDVEVAADTGVTLRIDYVVPGACWRPQHVAELVEEGGGARVEFATDACVWQNTGEDWSGVTLAFSTERVSLGTEPPRLRNDRLRWRKRAEELVVQAREQIIATTGLGVEAQAAPELPGIDDAGEVVNLRAAEPSDVPSDGRPYRVRLASFESDADVDLVAFPELSPCVFTRAAFTNLGKAPILAGPVELIRKSGPVGRTKILYVAPDERIELGWGPEAELRLRRTSRTRDEKSRMLSAWITRGHEVDIALSNLGDEPRTVCVTERVPVSEIEKLEIEVDPEETTRGARPDTDGLIKWTVELEPYGHDALALHYTVRKHEDVKGY